MSSAAEWRAEQMIAIEELKNDLKKWQADIRKDAKAWHDETLQQISVWKADLKEEIETMKGEIKDGNKRITGESASPEDLLGPSTGESNQVEADDTTRRKGRSRSTGAN